MQPQQIVLVILLIIEVTIFILSSIFLIRNREVYPIKQLSPKITLLLSFGILMSSVILSVAYFNNYYQQPQSAEMTIFSDIYIFFRYFIILTFYCRCLRISVAYFDFDHKIFYKIFSSELYLTLICILISLILPLNQIYEWKTYGHNRTQFFIFFTQPLEVNYKQYIFWIANNILFFVVLLMSLRVHKKLKFLSCLVSIYILNNIQGWYQVIQQFLSQANCKKLSEQEYFIPIGVLIISYIIILSPLLEIREYEHPLPNELILADHNMLFLNKEAYLILSKYSTHLELKSITEDERRRFSSKYLEIYTEFKILKKEVTLNNLESNIRQESTMLKNYVCKYIYPNIEELGVLKGLVAKFFQNDQEISQETVRKDLAIKDFKELDIKLTQNVKYMYNEWKKTQSKRNLQLELQKNNKIITRMQKLNISI